MDVKTTAPCSLQNSTTKSSEIAKVKMENSTTKPYEIAKVKMENTSNMEEVVTSSENAKEVKRGINEVLKEMDKEKKAKAAADQTFLDTLMADFPSEEKTNAMLGGNPSPSRIGTLLTKPIRKSKPKTMNNLTT